MDDWTEVSTPRERVHTIAETMQGKRSTAWVAEQALVDEEVARDVLAEMTNEGTLRSHGDGTYVVDEYRALADFVRDVGVETDEGVLIPNEVLAEWESPDR